jgi:uncharacterized Tic20 family protein
MTDETIEARPVAASPVATPNPRVAAMWCHLSAFAGIVPFMNIGGPLIVWLCTREQGPEVDVNGKEAVNFQMTMSAAWLAIYFVTLFFAFVALLLPRKTMLTASYAATGFEMLAYLALTGFWITVVVIAGIKTNNGEPYRYPLAIRLVR